VVAQVHQLVKDEVELRSHHRVVDALLGREGRGVDRRVLGLHLAIEPDLVVQRLVSVAVFAQPAVHARERGIVRVAAQVGGRHRVVGEGADEVAVAQLREHGWLPGAAGERAQRLRVRQNAEGQRRLRAMADERASVHGGVPV
jgi:hypothetical protein